MKRLVFEMRWPEVKEMIERGAFAVVLVGSNEQHGPHLPIETDSRLVFEVVTRALDAVGDKVKAVLTPVLWCGYSTHHMDFPGTLTLKPHTFIDVVSQICESLTHHGFKKILIVNGHGGNTAAIQVAARNLRDSHPDVLVATANYWDFIRDYPEFHESTQGCHSCEFETNLMLLLRSSLVDMKAAPKCPVKPKSKYFARALFGGKVVNVAENIKDLSATGCWGEPDKATREKGERLLSTLVKSMAEFFVEFDRWSIGNI